MNIAIVGMARSGLAAAEVLLSLGAHPVLYDSREPQDLAEAIGWADANSIATKTGANMVGSADLLVTSPGVRRNAPILVDAVSRGIPVIGEIEMAYRLADAPILAITGTNGKTTAAVLLGTMLAQAGIDTWVAGNVAAGEIALPLIKAAAIAPRDGAIIAEISSFQLEWVDQFRPRIAAITNITSDHLDRQTWDDYVSSKWRIFATQGEGDHAVLRGDLPVPSGGMPAIKSQVHDYLAIPRPEWFSMLLIPGRHNEENVLAAMAMASAFGVDEAVIERAATEFTGVVHRLEHVAVVDGVRYVNNSMCTNNAAFSASLTALPEPKIVLAGGVFKGGPMDEIARSIATSNVRHLILFGRSASEIGAAVRHEGYEHITVVDTMREAVDLAHVLALPADTVILNPGCASFDQFKDFEDRGNQFKQQVLALGKISGG
jgi:UDP-N-acetylmuramoylalanine--D-glutamate ligase